MVSKPHRSLLRHWLMTRSDWMEARVKEYAQQSGYGPGPTAMYRFFAQLGAHPIGLSDLARRMSISRQAVHKLAIEAERLGLVEFVKSEVNGRVKLLQFSEQGKAMSEMAARDFERIEQDLAAQIGEDNVRELKRILSLPWSETELQ